MGDYKLGYVQDPAISVADALAASAGFPVLVGPMKIPAHDYSWYTFIDGKRVPKKKSKLPKFLHLWDGGVYDNLGLEQLIRYGKTSNEYTYRKPIDYLIVSNVSGELDQQEYKMGVKAIIRLISLAKYQVESLRSRDVLHRFIGHEANGKYFDSDNYCEQILLDAGFSKQEAKKKSISFLKKEDAYKAARIATELKNLTVMQFKLLFRLGFEVADCTMHAYEKSKYQLLGYDVNEWEQIFHD